MILNQEIKLDGKRVFYRYMESDTSSGNILLLHGMRFTSATWEQHDLIEEIHKMGFNVYAVDYPGFGKSEKSPKYSVEGMHNEACASFLRDFSTETAMKMHCIIGPSIGGYITLAAISVFPEITEKAIVIAPAGLDRLRGMLKNVSAEVLLIWGDSDEIIPPAKGNEFKSLIKKSTLAVVKGAGHPVYLDKPVEFLKYTGEFLKRH